MNTFVASPNLALTVAHQTVADRVADAEHRALARTARAERRAALRETTRLSARPTQHYQLPWWAFRFTHPAH
jgi:hypothetical protein